MSLDGGQSKQQQQAHARMLLSLQKDAASARKQLLANFANYDALARRIKNLPPENYGPPEVKSSLGGKAGKEANGGDSAQERLQQAIWTRANLFLQLNVSAAPGRISPRTSAQISLVFLCRCSRSRVCRASVPTKPDPQMARVHRQARRVS